MINDNTMTLINIEDLKKEEINNTEINFENSNEFRLFPIKILQIALLMGLISEEQRDYIMEVFFLTIFDISDDVTMRVNNNQYIISCYLDTLDHYEAFQNIINIKNGEDVKKLLNVATNWFKKKALTIQKDLLRQKDFSTSIGISKYYNNLDSFIENILSGKIDLQLYDGSELFTLYKFVRASNIKTSYSVIKNLEKVVEQFSIEISIMRNLGKEAIIKFVNSKALPLKNQKIALESEIITLQTNLENLKAHLNSKLKECGDQTTRLTEKWDILEEIFQKINPNLVEGTDEYEDALSDFMDKNLTDDEEILDEEEIKKEYKEKISRINQKIRSIEININLIDEQIYEKIKIDNITLKEIINEFYYFHTRNSPSSVNLREKIGIFIKFSGFKFSENEIKYLTI